MAKKLGFAILSVAIDAPDIHANAWVKAIQKNPNIKLRGVWDHRINRGRKFAKRYNTDFIPELDSILNDPDIHMVGICSENNRHAELTIKSALAGKHVLCEKPMALNLDEANQVVDVIKKTGVKFMQCFPKRFCPIHQKTRELVQSGKLGKISSVSMRHGHPLGFVDEYINDWYTDPEQSGGGVIVDQAIHSIDFLRWVFGEPKSVFAEKSTVLENLPVEDNLVALLRFPDNVIATIESSWTHRAGLSTIEIFGDKGILIQNYGDLASIHDIPKKAPKPLLVWTNKEGWEEYDLPIYHKKSHEILAKEFFNMVIKDEESLITASSGKRVVEIILALQKSADTGIRISI